MRANGGRKITMKSNTRYITLYSIEKLHAIERNLTFMYKNNNITMVWWKYSSPFCILHKCLHSPCHSSSHGEWNHRCITLHYISFISLNVYGVQHVARADSNQHTHTHIHIPIKPTNARGLELVRNRCRNFNWILIGDEIILLNYH